MKKRILSVILVISMVAGMITALPITVSAATSGTCGKKLTWTFSDGALTIIGTGDMYNWQNYSTAPWKSFKDDILTVVIKSGVTSVGEEAFSLCDNLSSVTIPNTVTTLGESAFYGCDSITEMDLPDSIKTIKRSALGACNNLSSITIPKNVTNIEERAFWASDLNAIEVSKDNATYISIDGVLFNKDKTILMQYPPEHIRKKYEVPNSVEIIYPGAFNSCDNLIDLTIGNNITSIADSEWYSCKDLENLIIGERVSDLGELYFFRPYALKNITVNKNNTYYMSDAYGVLYNKSQTELICYPRGKTTKEYICPDGLTEIYDGAFERCYNLEKIHIPDSVTSIGDYAFNSCSSLASITIPDSVTSIGDDTFSWCDNLTDVYYAGSEEDWGKISIGSDNSDLTNATIHYNYLPLNSLFEKNAYDYNHLLAQKSFEFVEAGFSATTDEFTKGGNDTSPIAKKRYAKIKKKYDEYGFSNNQKFYNYGIALTDTSDKAAYSMASRDIVVNGKTKKIVALVVRGGNYGGEWVSNFNVGADSTYSQGFKKPADDIIEKLKSYISVYKSKDVVLWITGYSRGAAIANLVAANMVDYSENCSYLDAENIYAYTFATPNPVHKKHVDAGNIKYHNIFNIVNPADPVPYVLLSDWGYGRFGITKNILVSVPSKVKNYYKNYTGNKYSVPADQIYAVSNIVKLLSNLADTKQDFNKKYAAPIKDIVYWLMVDKYINEDSTLGEYAITKYDSNDVFCSLERATGLVKAYNKILKKAGISDKDINMLKEFGMIFELHNVSFEELLNDLTGSNSISLLVSVFRVISVISSLDGQYEGLGSVHESNTYRAWLLGLDNPNEIFGAPPDPNYADDILNKNMLKYKTQLIQCPVDVEVTDTEGNVVVSVVNHEILIDEIPVVIVDDKIKIYYYDNFDKYNTKITAYEDGEVNYYVSEYATGDSETKRVCYNSIEVSADDVLTGVINDEINTDVSNYNLTLSENIIENTEILEEEHLENLSVTVNEEGSGTATEIANASKGDYITLTATPYVGAEFIGWYDGEECLSKNAEYSFAIQENCEFIAKFTVTDVELHDITMPEISNNFISDKVTVSANNNFNGTIIWKAYDGDRLVLVNEAEVSMTGGVSEELTVNFPEDGCIDRVSVCLYDMNGGAKTTELSASIVRTLPTGENNSYKYVIYSNNKIKITEIKDYIGEKFEIPNIVDEYEVFAIGENLFKDKKELTEIIIPETVTQIDVSAFAGCENLKWLNFKGSVEEWKCLTLIGEELSETISIATNYENTSAKIHSVSLFDENEKTFATVDFDYVKEDARIYFAMYDSTGKMNFVKQSLVTPGKRTAKFEIDVEYDPETSYAKVFCWSNEDMLRPICSVYNFNFSQE